MTPSQQAKQYGCISLAQVGLVTCTPTRTLNDWHTTRPELFKAVCVYTATTTEGNKDE